jgi:16S rRNA (cytosine1402-N4)-methyltransferase
VGDQGTKQTPKDAGGGRRGRSAGLGHVPVLVDEIVGFLPKDALTSGGLFLDGTLGAGGHTLQIIDRFGARVRVLAFDRDKGAIELAMVKLDDVRDQVRIVHGSYAGLLDALDGSKADGMLLDLGLSNMQLSVASRGFAHGEDGPLDMRFDDSGGQTAREWLSRVPRNRLIDVLKTWGELPRPDRAADVIKRAVIQDNVDSTSELAKRIDANVRVRGRGVRASTLAFQAIRIEINGELDELSSFLERFPEALAPGGVACVMSYHSIEDRMTKVAFRELARGDEFELLTKKPVKPGLDETRRNRKSRSACLRAIRRVA